MRQYPRTLLTIIAAWVLFSGNRAALAKPDTPAAAQTLGRTRADGARPAAVLSLLAKKGASEGENTVKGNTYGGRRCKPAEKGQVCMRGNPLT